MLAQTYSIFLFISCLLFQFFFVKCQRPLAPALYVFGDSIVDSGNNDFLNTQAKANYNPYGIDFPSGATGRFTNGKTSVDYFAEWMGLPFARPYLALPESEKSMTTTGINYASGAAGILPETGTALGQILPLDEQIKNFEVTVTKYLPKAYKATGEVFQHLSKSIFIISAGSNDYINNYFQPAKYKSSKQYNPEQFATHLIDGLRKSLTKLHQLGARKMVVYGVGTIGCMPAVVHSFDPKLSTPCVEIVNNLILMFNTKLPGLLTELTSSLPQSTFTFADFYGDSYAMITNPGNYGFSGGSNPCCVVGGNVTTPCLPNQTPCPDRSKHFFYDSFHPSEAVYQRLAGACFNDTKPCVPINLRALTMKL